MSLRRLLLLVAMVWPPAAAELAGEEPTPAPRMRFMRVFAPAGREPEWPKGNAPLLPIEGEEFERLVKSAQAVPGKAESSSAARWVRARYEAAPRGQDVLAGVARFEVAQPDSAAALLPLSPCGLALDHARWEDASGASPNDDDAATDAELGLSPAGTMAVLVERPGVLAAEWSLAGGRDATGATAFTLALPRVPVSTLWLDLPGSLVPAVSPGVVVGEAEREGGVRRWHIELGGGGVTVMRLLARESGGERRRLALLRQASRYELSPAGLDLTVELKVDVHNEPLRRLELELDAELRLVSAVVSSLRGETAVPWLAPAGAADGTRRVTLEFPEPLLGEDRALKLRALAALVTDRAWRLPGIRPQGLFWQEGSAALLVPAPLSLDQLLTEGCRQSKAGPLAAPLAGESLELQFFSPEARIEARLSQQNARIVLDRGTSIVLTGGETAGAFVGEFHVDGGERYHLDADIDEGWIIDSVRSEPSNRLASWNVEAAGPTQRALGVRLTRALSRDRPVKLLIAGRVATSPLDRRFRSGDFRMLSFRGVEVGQDLLALATPNYRLQWSGADGLERLDPTNFSKARQRLFAVAPAGPVFDLAAGAGGWIAMLERQPARYTAEIGVQVRVSADTLSESYSLRCSPDAAALERVVAHFTRARPEPLRWRLGGDGRGGLAARRWLAEQEAAAGFGAGGETWEVTLAAPRTAAFELQAARATPLTAELPISLAALPEADAQHGTVVVRADGAVPLIVVNRRLQPVTAQPVGAGEYSTVRATYRYDPASELGAMDTAALAVRPGDALDASAAAFVWEGLLDSRFEAGGRGVHRASYRIENAGAGRCRVSLPNHATLAGLWVDGVAAPHGDVVGPIDVKLPSGRRFPSLVVEFVLDAESWGLVGDCGAAWPALDLVELSRSWRFSLPPGYQWLGAGGDVAKPPGISWPRRWFGPVGRPLDGRPFDATHPDDWITLTGREAMSPASNPVPPPAAPSDANAGGLPWGGGLPSGIETLDRRGWPTYELTATSDAPLEVRVVRVAAIWAAGWGLLAFVFACGRWWLRRKPMLSSIALGALGAAALLVPEALSPLTAGAFVGALAAGVLNLLPGRRSEIQRHAVAPASSARPAGAPLAMLLLVGGMALAWRAGPVRAADPAPVAKARPAAKLFHVFIPSDDQGKPTGARYQVPAELLAELRRRATAAANKPAGWLLQDASYRVALGQGANEDSLDVVDFKVRFGLRVFESNTRVRIPMSQEGVSLVLDSVALDGQSIPLAWDADGHALECDVREPGNYQLEFELRPVVRTDGETIGFDISVPPLPTSNVELTAPAETSGVEMLSIVGRVDRSEDGRRWTAMLGPAGRLTARWPRKAGAVGPLVDVDELLWLTVQPGAVVLDAVYQYKVSGGEVRRLEFIADPRLRLVPTEGPESLVADDVSTPSRDDAPNSPNRIQLDLKQPLADKPLRTRWLLTRTSGVGNIRLPLLRPHGARSVRRWLAVSVDRALEFKVHDDEALATVGAKDFMSGWGKPVDPPLLAYRLPAEDVSWNLATSTRDPLTTVKQTLLLGFQRGGAVVRFDAELSTTAGHCFQHRLMAPPTLQIDAISLTCDGAERAARWARDESGRITLFLTDRVTGPQRLSLRGRLPTPLIGSLPLPKLTVEGGESLSRTVLIYRRPDVKVAVEDRAGFDDTAERTAEPNTAEPNTAEPNTAEPNTAEPNTAEPNTAERSRDAVARLGRLVAALAATGGDASAVVAVAPNEPILKAQQVTSLRYQDEAWQVEVECLLNVENGLVDALRFEIPSQWSGPFEVTPPAAVEIDTAAGAGRRQLTIRPRAALEGPHRISVRGAYAAGDPVAAPDITLEAEAVERFVVLPRRIGTQGVAWKTTRLTPAKLPDRLAVPSASSDDDETFRVAGEEPRAVLTPIKPSAEVRRVPWADIRLAWHTDGTCRCEAAFDLDPAGGLNCPLRVPVGWRLVSALVGGVSVTPVPVADFQWRLPLSSSRLPQRIVVLATGDLPRTPSAGATVAIAVPSLGDFEAENALWTISSPAGWETLAADDEAHLVSPLAAELYRLRNLAGLLDLKDEVIHALPPDELANWYRPWARRLLLGRALVRRLQRQGETPRGDMASEADKILADDPVLQAKRLGVASVLRSIESAPWVSDQPGDLWERVSADHGSTTRYLAARHSPRPPFRLARSAEGDDFPRRVTAAIVVALAALVLAAGLAVRTPLDAWRQWPQVWGVAAGIGWWLWLTPSALGWVIVVLSLGSAWRSPWRPVREAAVTPDAAGSLH
ncbi:MAG TPA: hypothetical protein VMV69_30305 [Pirellulales bacterium]|nr:hypothetical protein [Pirellulales bacterium]